MGWADGARRIGARLAAMPPQEIVHRLVLAGRARADAAGAWRSSVRPLPEGLVDRTLPDLGVRPDPGALSEPWRASIRADAAVTETGASHASAAAVPTISTMESMAPTS